MHRRGRRMLNLLTKSPSYKTACKTFGNNSRFNFSGSPRFKQNLIISRRSVAVRSLFFRRNRFPLHFRGGLPVRCQT